MGRPNIGDRKLFHKLVDEMFDRRWLTNGGPLVVEFERKICEYIGTKHCVCMCNATIGLEIAIRAAKLDGEVIVPSFTFIATAHALQWQRIKPVFCDVDPITHCIDPARVEELITPRTTGIIGVHLWGQPCNIEALESLARQHKLTLLFDSAHTFGCSHKTAMLGTFGKAEIFSFHATKFFNTFEGGAVVTNDDRLAEKLRLMRNFGFSGYDSVTYLGTNGKMPEVSAAMGIAAFDSIEQLVKTNRRNFETYKAQIGSITGLRLLEYDFGERRNFQYIVVEVDENTAGLHRDDLLAVLHAENVLARRYFWPGCHRMEPYKSLFPDAGRSLAQTEAVADKVLVLPTGTAVGPDEIKMICLIIRNALQQSAKIRQLTRTLDQVSSN